MEGREEEDCRVFFHHAFFFSIDNRRLSSKVLLNFLHGFFDLAPKRETGGPQGRLFHSALFDTTVLLFFFFFDSPRHRLHHPEET